MFLQCFPSNIVGMDTSINDRLKQVRQALNLSQRKFAVGMFLKGNGYIGDLEGCRTAVNERIIELAASVYGVSKAWLKTGKGEMFEKGKKTDPQLAELQVLFNQLNPHFKQYALAQVKNLIKLQETKDT